MTRNLLVVEGQHDEAFIARILRSRYAFRPQVRKTEVEAFWHSVIPKTFPHNDDLRVRMPVPYFYSDGGSSVAIVVASGITQLSAVAIDTLAVLQGGVSSVGIVLDADDRLTPHARFDALRKEFEGSGVAVPVTPGLILEGTPRAGIYILPDNRNTGTLEDLLLECASVSYPAALRSANLLVESVQSTDYRRDDLREFNKPSGKNKARIAAITAILKPGKTAQASIGDNQWLPMTTEVPDRVSDFERFIANLLGLTASDRRQSGEPTDNQVA